MTLTMMWGRDGTQLRAVVFCVSIVHGVPEYQEQTWDRLVRETDLHLVKTTEFQALPE